MNGAVAGSSTPYCHKVELGKVLCRHKGTVECPSDFDTCVPYAGWRATAPDIWPAKKCAKKLRKGKCHKKKVRRNCATTCAAGAAA